MSRTTEPRIKLLTQRCKTAASEPAQDGNGVIELALNSNLTLQYAEARPAGMRIASALAADLASFALEVRPLCVPLAVASHSPL